MSKVLVGLLTATMCFGAVGCGGGDGDGGDVSSSGDVNQELGVTNPYKLSLFNFGGGYGREWLDALITRYKAERAGKKFTVDGVTYDGVDFVVTSQKTMTTVIIQSNVPYDIVFEEQVLYNQYAKDYFSPITEVLTTPNKYDGNQTIESKLTAEQKAFYKIDTDGDGEGDTYYGIPHYAGYVGISYNKKKFEEQGWYFKDNYDKEDLANGDVEYCFTSDASKRSAGPDGKKGTSDDGLPTTYEEFFALCDYISAKIKPISWAGKYREEYLNWFITALAANYEGLEQMSLNYSFNGTAKNLVSVDENGNVTNLPETQIDGKENGYELAKQAGKYYALTFLEKIAAEKWYTPSSIEGTKEQLSTQEDFVIQKDSAMLIDGCWWQMEADSYFDELQQINNRENRDDYAWMPLPCATEEQAAARAAKMQNGGNGYTLVDTHNSLVFLSKNISAAAKEIAVDFLQFAYTDVSLAEFSKITNTTKAVKYTMSDEDKAQLSGYGRSLVEIKEQSDIVYGFSQNAFFKLNETTFTDYKTLYNCKYTKDGDAVVCAFNEFVKEKSAKEYFDGLYINQRYNWDNNVIVK